MNTNKMKLSPEQISALLNVLKRRFEKNMIRHEGVEWSNVQTRMEIIMEKMWSLHEMERTGGEPDVIGHDKKTGGFFFYDCS